MSKVTQPWQDIPALSDSWRRVWRWHFGEGLVRTPDNFGLQGERPTHPELLDWLTVQFVRNGWSLKELHRTMLLSSTYRMSSRFDAAAAKADPENRLWWRFNIRRLEAEKDTLEAQSRALEGDPRAIERVAREQYGMHREGETVYRVRKPRN